MKIIINPDVLQRMLDVEEEYKPSIDDILNNKFIKNMLKNNLKVTGVFQETLDNTNLNNYVIKVTPID